MSASNLFGNGSEEEFSVEGFSTGVLNAPDLFMSIKNDSSFLETGVIIPSLSCIYVSVYVCNHEK